MTSHEPAPEQPSRSQLKREAVMPVGKELPDREGHWTRSDGHSRLPCSDWHSIIARWIDGFLEYRGYEGSRTVIGKVSDLPRGGWQPASAPLGDEEREQIRDCLRDNIHLLVPDWDEARPDIVAGVKAEIGELMRCLIAEGVAKDAALAELSQARAEAAELRATKGLEGWTQRARDAECAADIARAEAAEATKRAGIYGLDDCRKSAKAALVALGFPTEGYWDRWRAAPDKLPPFDAWHVECAILDALTQEGVAAWHGDASGCVTQIVQAQVKRAEAAEAERDRLKEVFAELCKCNDPNWCVWKQRIDAALAPQGGEKTT